MNRNKSVKWAIDNGNIVIDEKIYDEKIAVRGIYGIFIENECVYVGRSNSIYGRMFSSGHITMMAKGQHSVLAVNKAIIENKAIYVKILEEIPYKYDDYFKDVQRLASRENYYIDKYQKLDQCLSQVPEGTTLGQREWKELRDAQCMLICK